MALVVGVLAGVRSAWSREESRSWRASTRSGSGSGRTGGDSRRPPTWWDRPLREPWREAALGGAGRLSFGRLMPSTPARVALVVGVCAVRRLWT
ncbi:MAG TPA: hypothetical protein VET24_09270 [Actinomycetota bacterium]|nr:hypothetical protein [Actinomycetota bacterium]